MFRNHSLLPLFILLLSPGLAASEFYRWQDAQGQHHYADTPPENGHNTRTVELSLQSPLYVVEKVIDGDTISVRDAGRVRLLGINTPEVAHRERRAQPLGDEARQRLTELLAGKRVTLQFDQQRRDRFKRLLAHVTREDGTRINELLLQEGLARALFLQPNMLHLQRYYHIEAEAQQARRGIWSLPEYRLRPATHAQECMKRFCRLHGKVKKIVKKRHYTYLTLPGSLQLAVHHDLLPQFRQAGLAPVQLKGRSISVRGWLGERKGSPYLKLHHPLQISLTPP